MRALTTLGRKYSPLTGSSFSARSRKAGKRSSASVRKLRVKPHRFMDTMVSPGSCSQVSPPSRVERALSPSFSMWVCSVTLRRKWSAVSTHTPRATWPCSVTVFPSR